MLINLDFETDKKGKPFCATYSDIELNAHYFRWDKGPFPKKLSDVIRDPEVTKIYHNAPFDISKPLQWYGIKTGGIIHDTLLLAKIGLPFETRYGLKELMSKDPFNEDVSEYDEVKKLFKNGKGLGYDEMPRDLMERYSKKDPILGMKLFFYLKEITQDPLYKNLERKLIRTVVDMNMNGIKLDLELTQMKYEFYLKESGRLTKFLQERYKLDNPNSPKQISDLIYGKLNVSPPTIKGKTHYTTDDLSLKILKRDTKYSLFDKLLEYRKVTSMLKFLGQFVNSNVDGFIYPQINQMGDVDKARIKTGRMSTSNPNLQNLTRGSEIRELIVPREGHFFLDYDYSQVEMRLFAFFAKDPMMTRVYGKGGDVHKIHKHMFIDPYREEDGNNRSIAKSVGFEILYGIGAPGMWQYLAKQGIFIDQSKIVQMLFGWHKAHPCLQEFKRELYRQLRRNGFIVDPYNRKYFLPLAKSYIAVNYFIQGMSANIIKEIMPETNAFVKSINGRQLLSIHDELLFELPLDYYGNKRIIKDIEIIMESPGMKFNIPIIAEHQVLKNNWGEKT